MFSAFVVSFITSFIFSRVCLLSLNTFLGRENNQIWGVGFFIEFLGFLLPFCFEDPIFR